MRIDQLGEKERGTVYHTAATGPIVDWGSLIICLGVITVQKFRMSKLVKISKPIGGNDGILWCF